MVFRANDSACVYFSTRYVCMNIHAAWHNRQTCSVNFFGFVFVDAFHDFAILNADIHFFPIDLVQWIENETVFDYKFGHFRQPQLFVQLSLL